MGDEHAGDAVRVELDLVGAFLLEVIRAPLARGADVDLCKAGVVLDDTQGALQHALVAVFVALGQREGLEVGEEAE